MDNSGANTYNNKLSPKNYREVSTSSSDSHIYIPLSPPLIDFKPPFLPPPPPLPHLVPTAHHRLPLLASPIHCHLLPSPSHFHAGHLCSTPSVLIQGFDQQCQPSPLPLRMLFNPLSSSSSLPFTVKQMCLKSQGPDNLTHRTGQS